MELHAFNRAQRQQGMAMVEFTIVLPLLLLLLLAFGEFGRMLYQYNILLQASRDAGRYAASQALSPVGIIDLSGTVLAQTKNVAVYGVPVSTGSAVLSGLTTGAVDVAAMGADHVRVTITYTYIPVVGTAIPSIFGNQISLSIPLVASTVMRAL
jgi:Flp pilus assembly protein TadG